MQNFKKNLGFNLALIAIAVLFVAGCAMAFLAYRGSDTSALVLERARKDQASSCAAMNSSRAPRRSPSTIRTSMRPPPT